MEWNIAILGSVGSGKTTAIRTISDIDVVDTDVAATDAETLALKATTTVAMDMGTMELGNGDKLRLHGAPGQDRFDFMWEILLEQSRAAIVFVDQTRAERLEDLATYMDAIAREKNGLNFPVVVAISHAEDLENRSLEEYRAFFAKRSSCACSACQPPVLWCDAREQQDVAIVLVVMTALLEIINAPTEPLLHQRMTASRNGMAT